MVDSPTVEGDCTGIVALALAGFNHELVFSPPQPFYKQDTISVAIIDIVGLCIILVQGIIARATATVVGVSSLKPQTKSEGFAGGALKV